MHSMIGGDNQWQHQLQFQHDAVEGVKEAEVVVG